MFWGFFRHSFAVSEYQVETKDGCKLWASRKGDGPVLVLVHGGPGLADYLAPIQEELCAEFTVIRYDQRGCGESEGADGPFSITQSVSDLADVIRDAHHGAPVKVLGHSFGADLGLYTAMRHPELVTALVYLSGTGLSWPKYQEEWVARRDSHWDAKALKEIEALYQTKRDQEQEKALLRLLWEPDFAKRLPFAAHFKTLTNRWFGINYEANQVINHEVGKLDETAMTVAAKELQRPVLVVQGQKDPRGEACLDGLCDALPFAHRVVLDDVGHYAFLERADDFHGIVRDFFSSAGR